MNASRSPGVLPIVSGATASACLVAGAWLAWHHPLGAVWAMSAFAIATLVAHRWPLAWLTLMPALLPVIDLAPWSGWITFEEFDLLVLAVAAGGYARIARGHSERHETPHQSALSVVSGGVVLLFALSVLISIARGFNDAGGFYFGWFQGYHEPMNSVRLGKSFFLALLLLPLWAGNRRDRPDAAPSALSLGLTLGLAAASLATIWERLAFTDLLNFSADYRTTGLFWEMHVGGAALDGFLALTMPFAVRELVQSSTRARWGVAAVSVALGSYACLTTFSRGVYLAVPVGLVVLYWLQARQQQQQRAQSAALQTSMTLGFSRLTGPMLVASFCAMAGWMFQTSGYRGAAALLGLFALLLPTGALLRQLPVNLRAAGVAAGLVFIGAIWTIAALVPKGAYIAYGIGLAFSLLMVWLHRSRPSTTSMTAPMMLAGFLTTSAGVFFVAQHWGYAPATTPALSAIAVCVVLLLAAGTLQRPLWPDTLQWQASMVGVMAIAIVLIGVFSGGAYMGGRFSTSGGDMDGRLNHWKLGADMLRTPMDTWLGKGQGRFPSNLFLVGEPAKHPGDYRLVQDDKTHYLTLSGGLHAIGWGEYLRVSQRIGLPAGAVKVSAAVRTATNITLHFEVCQKHLLYNAACNSAKKDIKAAPGQWQTIEMPLVGPALSRGDWYAPKLLVFSVAMATVGGTADLAKIDLVGTDGSNYLANSDFSDDLSRWFFSSDRHHMPWHIKSMFMHVYFDQGLVGLMLWGVLVGSALLRLTVGKGRAHTLSPAMAASLVGFAVVGLFDSLLDVPRLAVLFYFLTLVGLTQRTKS